jgi:hypothetical protein
MRAPASAAGARRVDRPCLVLVLLGRVHRGVGGEVDDDVVPGDRRADRGLVGDVELGARGRGHVVRGEGGQEVLPEHAAAAGDEDAAHAGSSARCFSGSHQERLSRYHWTTSARPCSNGTCGA